MALLYLNLRYSEACYSEACVIMRLYCNDGSLGAKTWPCYI